MACSKLQVSWKRSTVGLEEDVIVTTLHFQDPTQAILGSTPMAAVEGAFNTWWASYKSVVWQEIDLHEYRWYDQRVWPEKSPLLRVTDITDVPGTAGTQPLPDQVACAVTLLTEHRKRWGRCYLPGPTAASLYPNVARWSNGFVDSTAAGFKDFLASCKAAFAIPVVWSPKGAFGPPAALAGSVLPVKSVRCDAIPDIIRSRRQQSNYYKKTESLP